MTNGSKVIDGQSRKRCKYTVVYHGCDKDIQQVLCSCQWSKNLLKKLDLDVLGDSKQDFITIWKHPTRDPLLYNLFTPD